MRVYESVGSSLILNECIWEIWMYVSQFEGIWKYMIIYECKG